MHDYLTQIATRPRWTKLSAAEHVAIMHSMSSDVGAEGADGSTGRARPGGGEPEVQGM